MARGVAVASEAALHAVEYRYACIAGGHGTGMCRECACFGPRLHIEQVTVKNAYYRERDVDISLERCPCMPYTCSVRAPDALLSVSLSTGSREGHRAKGL